MIECPKCGFKQPESDECIACGIVFSKYRGPAEPVDAAPPSPEAPPATQAPPAALSSAEPQDSFIATTNDEFDPAITPADAEIGGETDEPPTDNEPLISFEVEGEAEAYHDAQPETATLPIEPTASEELNTPLPASPGPKVARHAGVFRKDSRAGDTIGGFTMFIRSLAALACLGIAILMFLNGKGLISAWPYIIMVFYAGGALWGLSSFQQDITLQQFAIEMMVLVVVTLGLRVATPQMFAVEQPEVGVAAIAEPYLPATPIGRFTKQAQAYAQSAKTIIGLREAMPTGQWDRLKNDVNYKRLKQLHGMLSMDDQARVLSIWRKIDEVGPAIEGSLERHTQRTASEVNFLAPEAEREAVARELADASRKLSTLREMLLVYPESD